MPKGEKLLDQSLRREAYCMQDRGRYPVLDIKDTEYTAAAAPSKRKTGRPDIRVDMPWSFRLTVDDYHHYCYPGRRYRKSDNVSAARDLSIL